uniref:Aminopeptidase N-like N-terminal domain-containing protein n=1 Tax=Panagrolaimus davidi TaxID=227884 RepID=A0A914P2J6_9BILA
MASKTSLPTTLETIPTSTAASESKVEDIEKCQADFKNFDKIKCISVKSSMSQLSNQWLNASGSDYPSLNTLNIPHHYDLELRMNTKEENVFEGNVRILLELKAETDLIVLHAGRHVSDVAETRVNVFQCSNGEQICVQAVSRSIDQQLLLISLSKKISEGTFVVIEVSYFETVIPNNKGLFIQKSTTWEPWLIATIFENSGAHEIFPSINEKSSRSTFSLCLIVPTQLTARANMPVTLKTNMNDLYKVCFEKTAAIPSNQFGFVIFDNKSMQVVVSKNTVPEIEVFVGKHMKNADLPWITKEIQIAIERMTKISGNNLPLSKITVISAALAESDGSHSFGLILIKSLLFEYPKFSRTTTNIVKEVIEQWISSMLTICETKTKNFYLQESLATYLEWIVTEEIKSPNMTVKDRFYESRQRILPSEQLRSSALNTFSEADRTAVFFYSLEKFYNRTIIEEFFGNLFKKFGGKECATIENIADSFSEVTGSEVSKKMILSHANSNGYPMIKVNHTSAGSLTIDVVNESNKNVSIILPLKIVDSTLKETYHIYNQSQFQIYEPSKFIVVDPDSVGYHRTIYDVESYSNLATCFNSSQKCVMEKSTIKTVFSDFCWALFENKLDSNKQNLSKWHSLFIKLTTINHLIEGECSCCIRSQTSSKGKCLWIWKNRCENLSLTSKM